MNKKLVCSICNGTDFVNNVVLWDTLCNEWQISPSERSYIDRQQGTACRECGSNLRSNALARGILCSMGVETSLRDWVHTEYEQNIRILELNGAGQLTAVLKQFPGHQTGDYPEVDMHALPYDDHTFDLVVHSDTLEHVSNPVHALGECRRVLKEGGVLAFTVPVIIGRMSRDRFGLPPSFHGDPSTTSTDFSVATEYGADMWTHVILAGFDSVTIHTVDFPAATAMTARR